MLCLVEYVVKASATAQSIITSLLENGCRKCQRKSQGRLHALHLVSASENFLEQWIIPLRTV